MSDVIETSYFLTPLKIKRIELVFLCIKINTALTRINESLFLGEIMRALKEYNDALSIGWDDLRVGVERYTLKDAEFDEAFNKFWALKVEWTKLDAYFFSGQAQFLHAKTSELIIALNAIVFFLLKVKNENSKANY